MTNIYLNPSFYAHITNGIFLLISLILLYFNFSKIIKLDSYKLITLTLLFSGVIGIHGLSHLGLEFIYGYNPLKIENFYKLCMVGNLT
jgi:hypothetical protein